MKHVIVTGGAGYIGSHACKALSQRGYLPVVVDNMSMGHKEAVKWGPLEQIDVNERAIIDILQYYQPVAVLHFAGCAYVGESITNPLQYYKNNVFGTLSLLEAMRETGVRALVFSSSCAVYGTPERMRADERTPMNPLSPYGHTKVACENMIRDYHIAHGIRSVILRYFNAAGADPDGEIGENHTPEPHLIPSVLRAARFGHPVTVNGSHYPTPDGTCVRDYVHVTDLAQAHVLALAHLEKKQGGSFNLGADNGYSVLEVIAAAKRVTGRDIEVMHGPKRPGDAAELVSLSDKAREVLGWRPGLSDIDTIIKTAWEWEKRKA